MGRDELLSGRVPAGPYLAALFPTVFAAVFFLYIDNRALLLLFVTVAAIFVVGALSDRIVFDGRRLRRLGLFPFIWTRLNRSRTAIKLKDIEYVRTRALRSFKHGGRVLYAYRTTFYGRGLVLTVGPRGSRYRRMMRAVLPLLPAGVMDRQTIEVRDFLVDPGEVLIEARRAGIPAADVLEHSFADFRILRRGRLSGRVAADDSGKESVDKLRTLANQLKVSGRLLQSLEAFRRALLVKPMDGWLLLESARCLHAFASVRRDEMLERRAAALMRLSERYGSNDLELLTTLGESYFQIGDWQRAGKVFQKAVRQRGGTARTLRGLAEIALREGKLAHVIHNFSAANLVADTSALRRWTNAEVEYFSRLNTDDEYLELELGRVGLLGSLRTVRMSAVRISLFGFVVTATGLGLGDATVANIGWAVAGLAIMIFTIAGLLHRFFSQRIPPETMEEA